MTVRGNRVSHQVLQLLAQPAPVAAPRLIGWILAVDGVVARIAEVEAYQGEADRACHAARGRTARTEVLYAGPGTLYVYRCYGVHWMLNLVCDSSGEPAAVLVRSVEIIEGEDLVRTRRGLSANAPRRDDRLLLANGPGKVCQALGITGDMHGRHLDDPECPLTLVPPTRPAEPVTCGARIGVDYAGPLWARRRWRWWARGFPVVAASARV
jgi:DNA-3-methyladenine glycosylase